MKRDSCALLMAATPLPGMAPRAEAVAGEFPIGPTKSIKPTGWSPVEQQGEAHR